MAPFKPCSVCQSRTRKVLRAPGTLNKVYMCPTCFNDKEEKEDKKGQNKNESSEARKENVEHVLQVQERHLDD